MTKNESIQFLAVLYNNIDVDVNIYLQKPKGPIRKMHCYQNRTGGLTEKIRSECFFRFDSLVGSLK
jgi:hypothetical protein